MQIELKVGNANESQIIEVQTWKLRLIRMFPIIATIEPSVIFCAKVDDSAGADDWAYTEEFISYSNYKESCWHLMGMDT